MNLFIVFIEGIFSFLSPCILPLLPIYISILSNSSIEELQQNKFLKSDLFKNTIAFVFGISTTFFILGSSINLFSDFLDKGLINFIGGIIIIILGFFYSGILKISFLNREKRFNLKKDKMNILSAYILGFTFSFGWTPCVGPILASVLIMVSSVEDSLMGYILIGVYTLGFTLPFIMVSLFYKKLYKSINKIKENINIIKKIGGIILIITGIIMSYNGFKTLNTKEVNIKEESNIIDFSVIDQYENVHTLSEYKGKTIFLNFWATWCPPCREEMPDIQSIYEEYGLNKDDVIILGVVSPNYGREEDVDYIKKFIDENNYTFPILFDYNGVISSSYNVSSMPTTFIINKDGYMSKYVPGAMDKDTMIFLIENER